MKQFLPITILLAMFLVGCVGSYSRPSEKIPTALSTRATQISAISPALTKTPTLTLPVTPSSTPTTIPTAASTLTESSAASPTFPTPIPAEGVFQNCLLPTDRISSEFIKPEGQLIRYCASWACVLDFQNPGTNETVFSPTNLYPGSSPLVSPDGKWLAYMELTPNLQGIHQLWVISADMQQQITFPWKESWAGMIRWEGNSTLLLVDRGGSFLKFDPYTGKKIYITWPLEPPDINPGNVFLSPIMEVSPDGNQIVYLNLVGEYVFVDLQLNAALWKQIADPQVIVNLTSIKWSPDGNQVAIAARGKKGGVRWSRFFDKKWACFKVEFSFPNLLTIAVLL